MIDFCDFDNHDDLFFQKVFSSQDLDVGNLINEGEKAGEKHLGDTDDGYVHAGSPMVGGEADMPTTMDDDHTVRYIRTRRNVTERVITRV